MSSRSDLVIEFIECLTIPKGKGAGTPFKLREWQKRFIRDIYDPVKPDGRRLVRRAILSMARKNGKTALISALVLVHLCGPEACRNTEIVSAAVEQYQAGEVFRFCQMIIEADEELSALLEIAPSKYRIACPMNGCFYRAVSRDSKSKHGGGPAVVIFDEMAQSPKMGKDGVPTLYETLRSSQGAVDEPLFFVISTQSHDPEHPLSLIIDRGLAVNEDGSKKDPETVCHLYAAPDDADIMDPAAWAMANPALGDFCSLDNVRSEAENARDLSSFEPSFRNLFLNQRYSPLAGLVDQRIWAECLDPEARLEEGEEIYLGLDYADVGLDLCALVAVSATNGSRTDAWFWKPADNLIKQSAADGVRYDLYAKQGFLHTCPGRTISERDVAEKIIELCTRFKVRALAYDRYRSDLIFKYFADVGFQAQKGEGDGLALYPMGQGTATMSPAIDVFERTVLNNELRHYGHPLLTWTVANAMVTKKGHTSDRVFEKAKSKFRMDGAVALTLALYQKATDLQKAASVSPYEDPNYRAPGS